MMMMMIDDVCAALTTEVSLSYACICFWSQRLESEMDKRMGDWTKKDFHLIFLHETKCKNAHKTMKTE
jgi:hypothetical protein